MKKEHIVLIFCLVGGIFGLCLLFRYAGSKLLTIKKKNQIKELQEEYNKMLIEVSSAMPYEKGNQLGRFISDKDTLLVLFKVHENEEEIDPSTELYEVIKERNGFEDGKWRAKVSMSDGDKSLYSTQIDRGAIIHYYKINNGTTEDKITDYFDKLISDSLSFIFDHFFSKERFAFVVTNDSFSCVRGENKKLAAKIGVLQGVLKFNKLAKLYFEE